jgi:hypothetical protein
VGGSPVRLIARLLWIAPAIPFFLIFHQAYTALELRKTLDEGERAMAEVLELESSSRVEISYDYITLRIPLADGTVIVKEEMSLPHTLVPVIEGKSELPVRVRLGSGQEVVLEDIGPLHWKLAFMNMGMSIFGFVILFAGVFAWNRYLAKEGDPADRPHEETVDVEPA